MMSHLISSRTDSREVVNEINKEIREPSHTPRYPPQPFNRPEGSGYLSFKRMEILYVGSRRNNYDLIRTGGAFLLGNAAQYLKKSF